MNTNLSSRVLWGGFIFPVGINQCLCLFSCQFVVREDGDYSIHATDPDRLVDWDLIQQVVSSACNTYSWSYHIYVAYPLGTSPGSLASNPETAGFWHAISYKIHLITFKMFGSTFCHDLCLERPPVLKDQIFLQKFLHFNVIEHVTKDHLSWETTFVCPMGRSFRNGFTVSIKIVSYFL